MAGGYKTRTLCRLTGFKPELLRAWERRHALLAPDRSAGGHRLYTEDDLRLLLYVRARLDAGESIGEVAAAGRAQLLVDAAGSAQATSAPSPGGLFAQEYAASADALVAAAVRIDPAGVQAALDGAFALGEPDAAVDFVLKPAARRIGDLWESGVCSVAGEHLASAIMRRRLLQLLHWASSAQVARPRRALCACFPDELHENPALLVAYRLARRGWQVGYLGAALPFEDLARACERLRPSVVCLSVSRPEAYRAGRADLLGFAQSREGGAGLYMGGSGAPAEDAEIEAAGVTLCSSTGELPAP